jgi:hypothetical protein
MGIRLPFPIANHKSKIKNRKSSQQAEKREVKSAYFNSRFN